MTQARIVTVTLNPAIDISADVEKIKPSIKLRCSGALYEPGGGGVNVARVVRELGGDVTAFIVTGGETGRWLTDMLAGAGIDVLTHETDGMTRPSFHIRETSSDDLYRFMLPGPKLSAGCAEEIARAIGAVIEGMPGGYLVLSGSFPPGIVDGFLPYLASRCRADAVKLVVDTSASSLVSLIGGGAYLIKPNAEELEELRAALGWPPETIVETARRLLASETADVIVVTLGPAGSVLVSHDKVLELPSVDVPAVSRVGAGDSFVGGVVFALATGQALDDALRSGTAAGSAAIMTPGTGLARRADYEQLLSRLR